MSMFNDPKAFVPFFSDLVRMDGTRPSGVISLTVKACVFWNGMDESLVGTEQNDARELVDVEIMRADWPEVSPPEIGDRVTDSDGREAAVYRVDITADEFILRGRSVK